MNKVNSGPRRVFVSYAFRKADYVPLSDADWLTLQTKLKRTLSPTTRKRLNTITKKYESFARPENAQRSLKDVQQELNDWGTRTQRLRNILWPSQRARPKSSKGSSARNAKKIASDFSTVLDRHFSGDISAQELIYPLALLDRFLSGAIAVSECTEQTITSRHVANNPETELWFFVGCNGDGHSKNGWHSREGTKPKSINAWPDRRSHEASSDIALRVSSTKRGFTMESCDSRLQDIQRQSNWHYELAVW